MIPRCFSASHPIHSSDRAGRPPPGRPELPAESAAATPRAISRRPLRCGEQLPVGTRSTNRIGEHQGRAGATHRQRALDRSRKRAIQRSSPMPGRRSHEESASRPRPRATKRYSAKTCRSSCAAARPRRRSAAACPGQKARSGRSTRGPLRRSNQCRGGGEAARSVEPSSFSGARSAATGRPRKRPATNRAPRRRRRCPPAQATSVAADEARACPCATSRPRRDAGQVLAHQRPEQDREEEHPHQAGSGPSGGTVGRVAGSSGRAAATRSGLRRRSRRVAALAGLDAQRGSPRAQAAGDPLAVWSPQARSDPSVVEDELALRHEPVMLPGGLHGRTRKSASPCSTSSRHLEGTLERSPRSGRWSVSKKLRA